MPYSVAQTVGTAAVDDVEEVVVVGVTHPYNPLSIMAHVLPGQQPLYEMVGVGAKPRQSVPVLKSGIPVLHVVATEGVVEGVVDGVVEGVVEGVVDGVVIVLIQT